MDTGHLDVLRLLQLADSALPVGSAAHSFGLETLVEDEALTAAGLESFLADHLAEAGAQEGAFCRAAHRLAAEVTRRAQEFRSDVWLEINRRLSARKGARESRSASATLGRRLLGLASELERRPPLTEAAEAARRADVDTHHSAAFGLVGGAFGLDEEVAVEAYLHQTLYGLVSACQRLMPLGQTRAQQILWRLKPSIVAAAELSRGNFGNLSRGGLDLTRDAVAVCEEVCCFTPLLDLGSMRHTSLTTRLFIS
jgi:urease accessory protein